MSAPTWIIFVLPATLLATGIVLAAMGWRGRRIGDHPLCRRCGFDLYGLPETSGRCPECGADLGGRRAVVLGHRRRRAGLLFTGLVLLLPSFLWLSAVAWVVARDVDVNRYKPVWWLARDAASADSAVRRAAMGELATRYRSTKLSDAQASSVVDDLLDLQGDVAREWDTRWGDFVEDVMASGKLAPEQKTRYLRQAPQFELKVRPVARKGAYLPAHVSGHLRAGARTPIAVEAAWTRTEFATGTWERASLIIDLAGSSRSGIGLIIRFDEPMFQAVKEGPQRVRVHLRVRSYDAPQSQAGDTTPVVEQEVTLDAPWTLVEADTPTVRLVTDPQLWPLVRDALHARILLDDISGLRADLTAGRLHAVDLAFGCTVRSVAQGQQWYLGEDAAPRGNRLWLSFQGVKPAPDLGGAPVDLVLEPSIDAAEQTVELTEIWGGTVMFRDMPIGDSTAPPEWLRPPQTQPARREMLGPGD